MNYQTFQTVIASLVQKRLGGGYELTVLPVTRNNGLREKVLSIREKGSGIAPVIYLRPLYEETLNSHMKVEEAVEHVVQTYLDMAPPRGLNLGELTGGKAGDRIVCRLVNTDRNRGLLREVPHRDFLDMSVICCLLVENGYLGSGAILLSREHLRKLRVGEEMLFHQAYRNTRQIMPAELMTLSELVRELGRGSGREDQDSIQDIPVFVLTNTKRYYGALWITDRYIQRRISELVGSDYYVLPSSVHECLILPARLSAREHILARMVREINSTILEPQEILSDSVYLYVRGEELKIAA